MIINGERSLAYVVKVDDVKPIDGYDRIAEAIVGGWHCIVQNTMKSGDLAVFIEIDSLLPAKDERFAFCEKYKYRIKTQKMCKGKVISQGLLMPLSTFPELANCAVNDDVTKKLGIIYYEPEDNIRKANTLDKYKSMAQMHPNVFKRKLVRRMYKSNVGKKILYVFFGRKRIDNSKRFPTKFPYVHHTDEERVENIPCILENQEPWVKTLKIDGTSTTFILEKKRILFRNTYEFYVCSRNVRMLNAEQNCYHDKNVYWDMAEKYRIKNTLRYFLDTNPQCSYVCVQGETAGVGVQGNPHKLPDTRFYVFNLIDSENGRWNSAKAAMWCEANNVPFVPIISEEYILPDDMETFKMSADGEIELPNASGLREGYVYRSQDGVRSFKNVSRQYLMEK